MTTFEDTLETKLNEENLDNDDIITWALEQVSKNDELAYVLAALWIKQLMKRC